MMVENRTLKYKLKICKSAVGRELGEAEKLPIHFLGTDIDLAIDRGYCNWTAGLLTWYCSINTGRILSIILIFIKMQVFLYFKLIILGLMIV